MPVYKDPNKKTNDGRMWYFKVSYKLGDKHKIYQSKMYVTKKEAEKEEAKYLVTIGKIRDENALTFNEIIIEYFQEKSKILKPQSLMRSKVLFDYVAEQLGDVPIVGMTTEQYEKFRDWIDNHDWSDNYKNKTNKMLKSLINYAFKKHGIDNRIPYRYGSFANPIAPVKTMDFYTYDEFQKFIGAADDIKFEAMFKVMYFCGTRLGETNCLQWKDINDLYGEHPTMTINKTVSTKVKGKGSKYLITSPKTKSSIRTIPIQKTALESLKMLREYYEQHYGFNTNWYIFGGIDPIPETTITKAKDKYAKVSKQKIIRLHDLRHSCASFYIHLGATPATLSALLGHSSVQQTLSTYTHWYLSDLNNLILLANKY